MRNSVKISSIISFLLLCGLHSFGQTTVVLEDVTLKAANPEMLSIQMSLFPNPAVDKIFVDVDGAEQIYTAEIFDLSGKLLRTVTTVTPEKSVKLSVATLPAGTFLLSVHTEKAPTSARFVIQR